MDETQSTQLEPRVLQELLHLTSTEVAEKSYQRFVERMERHISGEILAHTLQNSSEAKMLVLCRQRDELLQARPEGCWCLGLGENERTGKICRACPEGQALRHKRNEEEEQRNELRREARWEQCGIPFRFQYCTLETSPLKDQMPELVHALGFAEHVCIEEGYCETLDAHFDRWIRSWMLWGDYGVGKTGLAVGYAREALFHGGGVPGILFTTLPDLLAELRATYNRQYDDGEDQETEEEVITKYASVEYLILDDIGAEQVKNQEWLADRLYRIIGKRHSEKLPVFFTSNLSMSELGEKLGERVMRRIIEMCGPDNFVEIKGPNLRDKQAR